MIETLPLTIQSIMKVNRLKVKLLPLFSIHWFLIKKFIGINKHDNIYKQRFTCCHELGHYVKGDLHDLPWIPHFKSNSEKKADEYAMAALIPDERLLEEWEYYQWDCSMLEKVFWVEMWRIEKRLSELQEQWKIQYSNY